MLTRCGLKIENEWKFLGAQRKTAKDLVGCAAEFE